MAFDEKKKSPGKFSKSPTRRPPRSLHDLLNLESAPDAFKGNRYNQHSGSSSCKSSSMTSPSDRAGSWTKGGCAARRPRPAPHLCKPMCGSGCRLDLDPKIWKYMQ